jgi:ankyrin repeat protein
MPPIPIDLVNYAKTGNLERVKECVKFGLKDILALKEAAKNGHYEVAEYLLKNGYPASEGLVYSRGNVEMVKLFLKYRADPKTENYVIICILNGYFLAADLLIERGANIRADSDRVLREVRDYNSWLFCVERGCNPMSTCHLNSSNKSFYDRYISETKLIMSSYPPIAPPPYYSNKDPNSSNIFSRFYNWIRCCGVS